MGIPLFFKFNIEKCPLENLKPASLRDRIIAQFIDGFILSIIFNMILLLFSKGEIYTLWISPMVPIFLLQVPAGYLPEFWDWIWGGYFWTISPGLIAELYASIPSPLSIIIYGFYYIFLSSFTGQTPGKKMKGLVILDESGNLPGKKVLFLRWVYYFLSLLPISLGFWLINSKNQCWHDKISKTCVHKFNVLN
jgi:uncharacterized RDD family membrane protein YckC